VYRSPRKLETEDQLYASAMRALMRRAHSIYEMKQALGRRAADAGMIPAIIARLRASNYLDDARYARDFARLHATGRRQGRFRIERELRKRGVPDRHIEAALADAFAETDEGALVRKRIERKLKLLRGPLDPRRIASLFGSLLRAGFPADLIRRELRAAARTPVELPQETPDFDAP
jgi:regulatory protein